VVDVNVIRSAKLGDAASFAQVYDAIAPELYKVALYTLGNPQDAEDAVSETFVEAFKGIKNLREEASFKRWMMTILSVRCKRRIGGYIKERKTENIDDLIDLPAPDSDQPSPEKLSVREALAALEPQERQIVVLVTVQGYTTREAAQILGLPHGTVSSKLFRTLKKLRKQLD
jgi:RNA polymerase sigma-70 factor (ECF subfamily)